MLLEAKKGDSYATTATLFTNPELEAQTISFKLNATSESSTPRPLSLKAAPKAASTVLTWAKGNGAAVADGYNVYRNHVKVNAAPVKEMQFTDTKLVYGKYSYQVTAVYNGKESAKSDSVVAFVNEGCSVLCASQPHFKHQEQQECSPELGFSIGRSCSP